MKNHIVRAQRVVGIDGCRAGWVIASREACVVVPRLADAIADLDAGDVVGIDMPIGLAASGPRRCDVEARRFLSPRGSTVFPTPARGVLHHTVYAEANAASRLIDGRGLPRQSFALFAKIREVDELVRTHPATWLEIHPECAFARMSGQVMAPKRTPAGAAARRELIERHIGPVDVRRRGAQPHDVLDAYAVLWSARRYATGGHVTFGEGDVDELGLPMRIVS